MTAGPRPDTLRSPLALFETIWIMPPDTIETSPDWRAAALAVPIPPLPPDVNCATVYEMMEGDETIFALPIVHDDQPIGITGRISLLRQFARPYWREVYAQKPIARLMDAAPLIVDAGVSLDVISRKIATENKAALSAGFIVTRENVYAGVASTIDLLRLSADQARLRAQELGVAHRAIRELNEDLEHRVQERTAQLRSVQEEMLRKERMSALGQLTATVAHELRNPLSSIRNTVFTIKEALGGRDLNLERPVGRIERSIERCDGIIADLLEYTRSRDLRCRTVMAEKWLAEALADQPLPKEVTLRRKFMTPGQRINLDPERMRRVLVNLIDNAVEAMMANEDGGERVLVVGTRLMEGRVELLVEDTGPGIAPDVLPRIFEPLFSTKSFGTGLGLPTVKQIVEQHCGEIAIDSEPGRGTRVAIILPIQAPAAKGDVAA